MTNHGTPAPHHQSLRPITQFRSTEDRTPSLLEMSITCKIGIVTKRTYKSSSSIDLWYDMFSKGTQQDSLYLSRFDGGIILLRTSDTFVHYGRSFCTELLQKRRPFTVQARVCTRELPCPRGLSHGTSRCCLPIISGPCTLLPKHPQNMPYARESSVPLDNNIEEKASSSLGADATTSEYAASGNCRKLSCQYPLYIQAHRTEVFDYCCSR